MASPIINIISATTPRISDKDSKDISIIKFVSDQDLIEWEARADSVGMGSGGLVGDSGAKRYLWNNLTLLNWNEIFYYTWESLPIVLKAGEEAQFEVENEELLWGDKVYRIDVYGRNINDEVTIREPMKVRYIRDWLGKGSTANTGNHWCEIEVIDTNGINVALNKPVTSSVSGSNLSRITDGNKTSSSYASVSSTVPCYIQIDLGAIYNIDEIRVWHYYSDSRTYLYNKTEVSEDGVNWDMIFNTDISGTYKETSSGRINKIEVG